MKVLSIVCIMAVFELFGCNNEPTPTPGQWIAYGGNEPTISNASFAFPTDSNHTAGYFYTKLSANGGQTLTLTYDITGSNPVWAQSPHTPMDINPASLQLFLWRNGDDLSCAGAMASYRFWTAHTLLALGGNQTVSAKLDGNVWTNCLGKIDASGFAGALANELGLGFTFGGAYYAGHGVYLSSGSATFKIKSFTVQ